MDPETAVDNLRDLTKDAEAYLRHARNVGEGPLARSHHIDARELLDEAGAVWDDLSMWVARGGYRPRRLDTWTDRYRRAEQEWSRQAQILG